MKNKEKKYPNVWSETEIRSKIIERGQMDICNTKRHDRWLPLLGTATSIETVGVKLVLLNQTCNTTLA